MKDADLPTYQETDELINKLEYERTHTGSLLFEKYGQVTFTGSATVGARKLLDGVRDVVGWTQVGDKEKFVEMNLTKLKPEFSKIVISGYGLENMKLTIRNGEELSEPEALEVKTEEFSVTYLLKAPISPDALRMDFNSRRVELYEIEVF